MKIRIIKLPDKQKSRNAAKWHSDGGYINQAINDGKIDIILAAINNIKNKKLG